MKQRSPNKLAVELSQKHESSVRDKLAAIYEGTRLQPGSGNQLSAPNDIVAGPWHVECKFTNSGSLRIPFEWLTRLRKLAMNFGKRGLLAIRFGNEDYYVVRAEDMYSLLHCEAYQDYVETQAECV